MHSASLHYLFNFHKHISQSCVYFKNFLLTAPLNIFTFKGMHLCIHHWGTSHAISDELLKLCILEFNNSPKCDNYTLAKSPVRTEGRPQATKLHNTVT